MDIFNKPDLGFGSYKNDDAVGLFPYKFIEDCGALEGEPLGFNSNFGKKILKEKRTNLLNKFNSGDYEEFFPEENISEICRMIVQEKGWQLFYEMKEITFKKIISEIPSELVDFSVNTLLYSEISKNDGYKQLFKQSINPRSLIYSIFEDDSFRRRVANGAFWQFARGNHSGWDCETLTQEFLLAQNNHLLDGEYSIMGKGNSERNSFGFKFSQLSLRALRNYSLFVAELVKQGKSVNGLVNPFVETVNRNHSHFDEAEVFEEGRKDSLLGPLIDVGVEVELIPNL